MRTLACCCRSPEGYVSEAAIYWLQCEAECALAAYWEERESRAERHMRAAYYRRCWKAWIYADMPDLADSDGEQPRQSLLQRPAYREGGPYTAYLLASALEHFWAGTANWLVWNHRPDHLPLWHVRSYADDVVWAPVAATSTMYDVD